MRTMSCWPKRLDRVGLHEYGTGELRELRDMIDEELEGRPRYYRTGQYRSIDAAEVRGWEMTCAPCEEVREEW